MCEFLFKKYYLFKNRAFDDVVACNLCHTRYFFGIFGILVFFKIKRKCKFNIFACEHMDSHCSATLMIYIDQKPRKPRNFIHAKFYPRRVAYLYVSWDELILRFIIIGQVLKLTDFIVYLIYLFFYF